MKRSSKKEPANGNGGPQHKGQSDDVGHEIDRYRSIVFPNMVRDLRRQAGFTKLLALSAILREIPYVRLSKIERGEVFAKSEELRQIAGALKIAPEQLLIDIDAPNFDIADWAADLHDWVAADPEEDRFAVELAAAIRTRRDGDKALSIAAIERDYGIAPVILSRLENAYKTFDRWNGPTVRALCHLFGVADAHALRDHVADAWASGMLDAYLPLVANPAIRIAKTRARVATLRNELAADASASAPRMKAAFHLAPRSAPAPVEQPAETPVLAAIQAADSATVRMVPVFGSPLPDGLIERTATAETVEAPRRAGPNTYGLRVCRPTLGPGLPAHATVVVDPDRFPTSGGIAVLRETAGMLRLLIVTVDRQGRMIGYSLNPDREVALDGIDPADMATVISVSLE